jgi:hypothetical protein
MTFRDVLGWVLGGAFIPFFGPAMLSLGLGCMLRRFSPHTLWFWIIDWPTVGLPLLLWRRICQDRTPEAVRVSRSDVVERGWPAGEPASAGRS